MNNIIVAETMSPNLALRNMADSFFDSLEKKEFNHLQLDFTGIKSISRSFAHQYILRKKNCSKTITEMNVPDNVSKMMGLVTRSSASNKHRSLISDLNRLKVTML